MVPIGFPITNRDFIPNARPLSFASHKVITCHVISEVGRNQRIKTTSFHMKKLAALGSNHQTLCLWYVTVVTELGSRFSSGLGEYKIRAPKC